MLGKVGSRRRVLKFVSSVLFVLAVCAALAGALIAARPAMAQGTLAPAASETSAQSVADLEALAATLSDDSKRAELLAAVRGLIDSRKAAEADAARSLSERLVAAAETTAVAGKQMFDDIAGEIGGIPGVADWFNRLANDSAARQRLVRQLSYLAIILAAAWAAEVLVWAALRGPRRRLAEHDDPRLSRRVPLLIAAAVLDLVPLAGFAAGGYGAYIFVKPQLPGAQVGAIGLQFLIAYVLARGLLVLSRAIFAPGRSSLRVPPVGDETANYLYVWARRFVNTIVFGYFTIEAVLLLGMPRRGYDGLVRLLGVIVVLLLIVFILQNRAAVANWLRGGPAAAERPLSAAPLRRGLAAVWHILAIAYTLGVFAAWAWEIKGGFSYLVRASVSSALVIAAATLLLRLPRRLLERGFGVTDAQDLAYPRLKARANLYLPYVYAGLRVFILGVMALALFEVWGLDVWSWMRAPLGSRIIGGVASIAIVVAIAVAVWELAGVAIERRIAEVENADVTPERGARVRTLLPLLRKALLAVLSVMVALIVLAELGVNIGPLLAGAGIVGLAVGFGAQTLVKDLITGAFMLIEDALAVGDVVTVAGIGGVVEGLSIRSIRLRDLSGNVHTIPFSSVDTVTNMTKDFSYYLLDIAVAYREDTDEVARICCEILDEMRAEPEYGPLILDPLEVLGVDQFADSAVIVKARIKTRPIKQWFVGREFNRRMKKRFDALGIEIPFPHRTIYFGADKAGAAPAAHVRVDGATGHGTGGAISSVGPAGGADLVESARVDLPDPHPEADADGDAETR